jgi:uncharacterized membrane protein (DUF4010 family)
MELLNFQQLGIAVLLGLLVGLQREHAASGVAGMRTFPLITVFGCLSAMLAVHFQESLIVAAGLGGIIAVAIVGHLSLPRSDAHPGTTTDVAMLLMYAVGAFVVVGPMSVAIAVGGGVAVLLQFKPELHGVAQKLGDVDLRAIMQFVLITCIILPVLPNQSYDPFRLLHPLAPTAAPGPFAVLNPFEIWLMVVLIVGLTLGGYISYKFFGRDAGILLGGILGGAISSTATTVSYARGTRDDPTVARSAVVVIMIASTVMYVRILLEVAVVSQEFLQAVVPPMAILMVLTLAPAMALWFCVRREPAQMPEQRNPTHLTSALVFGAMYAAVLLALAVEKYYWRSQGLFAVAFFSGLTETDAITLSTARMFANHQLIAANGWQMIVVAVMANFASKAGIAGLLGGWRLLARVAMVFAVPMLGGVALLTLL